MSDQILMDVGPAEPTRLRVTALLWRDDSQWRVSAGHCSIPLSNKLTRALVEAGELPAGVALADTVGGNAQELVELLDECLANPARFAEVCSTRADTVAFGSAAEEVFYGPNRRDRSSKPVEPGKPGVGRAGRELGRLHFFLVGVFRLGNQLGEKYGQLAAGGSTRSRKNRGNISSRIRGSGFGPSGSLIQCLGGMMWEAHDSKVVDVPEVAAILDFYDVVDLGHAKATMSLSQPGSRTAGPTA